MIVVNEIEKSFGKVKAVRGVSFNAPDGKITGLLGPNGAGKSTTLRVLYTVLRPDAGTALIDGVDVVKDGLAARRQIGALPHGAGPMRRGRSRRRRRRSAGGRTRQDVCPGPGRGA